MNQRDCTIGFLIGISTGAAIGLLIAPKAGKARRFLHETTKELKSQANDLLDSANAIVGGGMRKQEGLKNAVEAGKKAYDYTTST